MPDTQELDPATELVEYTKLVVRHDLNLIRRFMSGLPDGVLTLHMSRGRLVRVDRTKSYDIRADA